MMVEDGLADLPTLISFGEDALAAHRSFDPVTRHSMRDSDLDLFCESRPPSTPPGFEYRADFINETEELDLVTEIQALELAPYEFRGVEARRRVIAFGFRHDYRTRRLEHSSDMPPFLKHLRSKAAAFAGLPVEDFKQVLVSEYTPGTPIGWHKDREHYDRVVGVSLLSAATFRFRRQIDERWMRQSQLLEPRSVYLLTGPARDLWQHSIPAVPALRYSVTFRTMRLGYAP
jgi:alkylated DNA repair dioxygenase AlkB